MKKIILVCIGFSLLSCISFKGVFAGKTTDNLKAAYKGEMTASVKYTAYAEQARKEGLTQIALLFTAVAKSESIHAANHKMVLEKMGDKAPEFQPEFITKTTKENLQAAIDGESAEINSMYPGYIGISRDEGTMDATKSMRWAMETEKKHLVLYRNALEALNSNKVNTLPTLYWVCPKCCNTYNVPNPEAECGFCGTKNTKFIKFV